MDVTQLPLNRLLGLESAPARSEFLVSLPDGPQYTNHIGTVHAIALLAVAEAGSAAFLIRLTERPSKPLMRGQPLDRRLEIS